HNGFLQVEGQKMSKSLGNFFTIRQLLDGTDFGGRSWPGEVLRLAMLMTHYRQPIDFSVATLAEASKTLASWGRQFIDNPDTAELAPEAAEILGDDLNTPALIAWLHKTYNQAERGDASAGRRLSDTLRAIGIADLSAVSEGTVAMSDQERAAIDALCDERLAALNARDFAKADKIRADLAAMGIQLMDGKDVDGNRSTKWEVKR
ncbi:MAG: cysteine--tRNA ligase, partial [Devosia sp.]